MFTQKTKIILRNGRIGTQVFMIGGIFTTMKTNDSFSMLQIIPAGKELREKV
jgi:hypothetical protein